MSRKIKLRFLKMGKWSCIINSKTLKKKLLTKGMGLKLLTENVCLFFKYTNNCSLLPKVRTNVLKWAEIKNKFENWHTISVQPFITNLGVPSSPNDFRGRSRQLLKHNRSVMVVVQGSDCGPSLIHTYKIVDCEIECFQKKKALWTDYKFIDKAAATWKGLVKKPIVFKL
jgi:hypothetical protein